MSVAEYDAEASSRLPRERGTQTGRPANSALISTRSGGVSGPGAQVGGAGVSSFWSSSWLFFANFTGTELFFRFLRVFFPSEAEASGHGVPAGRRAVQKAPSCRRSRCAVPTVIGRSAPTPTTCTISSVAPDRTACWNASVNVSGRRTPGVGRKTLSSERRRTGVALRRTVVAGLGMASGPVRVNPPVTSCCCPTFSLACSRSLPIRLTQCRSGLACTSTKPGADGWPCCALRALIRPERVFRRVTRHSP